MAQLSWWHPSVDLTGLPVHRYQTRELFSPIAAGERPDFIALLRTVTRTRGVVLAENLETFGATMGDYRKAVAYVSRAGGTLYVKAELQGDRVRAFMSSPPFERLLADLPADTRINVRPISQSREFAIPRSSYITNEVAGKYHVYVMEDAPPEVIAHEILHAVLDHEGYPVFREGPNAGVWESALADVEIEARLLGLGFTDLERLDGRCRDISTSDLSARDFEWLVTFYVTFSLYTLPREVNRGRLRQRIQDEHPDAAAVGEALIRLIDRGVALRDAKRATAAFNAVAEYLDRSGVATLTVTHVTNPESLQTSAGMNT